jgi:hypothetical protein
LGDNFRDFESEFPADFFDLDRAPFVDLDTDDALLVEGISFIDFSTVLPLIFF